VPAAYIKKFLLREEEEEEVLSPPIYALGREEGRGKLDDGRFSFFLDKY
jgi:hypothetical protein